MSAFVTCFLVPCYTLVQFQGLKILCILCKKRIKWMQSVCSFPLSVIFVISFKSVEIQVVVFRVVTPYGEMIGYRFTLKTEAARSPETLVSYHVTIRRQNPEDHVLNLCAFLLIGPTSYSLHLWSICQLIWITSCPWAEQSCWKSVIVRTAGAYPFPGVEPVANVASRNISPLSRPVN
jgi:hypothetical protein